MIMGKKKQKYYKAFNKDLCCRGFQYEIGKTYKMDESPVLCRRGFHFCDSVANVYSFYAMSNDTRVCEVEPLGEIVAEEDGSKFVTNEIKIVKEIKLPRELSNVNKSSSGYCNSGNSNSGNWNFGNSNSGNGNSGDRNSGDYNSGDCNSGNYNFGYCNSGDRNWGNYNSGDRNSGYKNSGDENFGHHNSGDKNWGNKNSGKYNSGNYNSGDWNSGNRNSGVFNTIKKPTIKMFNKQSNWTYDDWRYSEAYYVMRDCPYTHSDFIWEGAMTDKEKKEHPEYKTTGGYVKDFTVTAADKQKWWDELNDEDKRVVLLLPNFDARIFKECTEIDVGDVKHDD